jgi:hypothetical protein
LPVLTLPKRVKTRHPKPSASNRSQTTLNLREITMDQLASMRIFLAVVEANALNGSARRADV